MFLSLGSVPCVFVHPTIDAWADMRRETTTLKSAEQVHASNTLSCRFCHLRSARRRCHSEHVRSECTMWDDYTIYNPESFSGEVHHVGSSLTVLSRPRLNVYDDLFGSGGAWWCQLGHETKLCYKLGVWFKRWEREEGREDVIKCCMMGNVGKICHKPPRPVLL